MSSITVHRGVAYSEDVAVSALTGETYVQFVWSWRAGSNPYDWKISKTVAISESEAASELSASETAGLPFGTNGKVETAGRRQWYYVHGTTGVMRYGGEHDVICKEITGSLDTNSLTPRGHYTFASFGALTADVALGGTYTLDGYESFCRIDCDVQTVATGSAITFALYLDGVDTGESIELGAGVGSNTASISPVLQGTAAEVLTVVPTAVGSGYPGAGATVTVYWY